MSALLGILGVALDARFGEPQGWHPLVAFGRLADRLERRFNRSRLAGEGDPGVGWRSHGVTAWVLAVLPLTLLAWALAELPYLGWLVQALALYAALGLRSLGEHAEPVALALRAGDLDEARRRVGYLVSRDTRELDQAGSPARPPNRYWRTAATRSTPRCSGSPWPARRGWCCIA